MTRVDPQEVKAGPGPRGSLGDSGAPGGLRGRIGLIKAPIALSAGLTSLAGFLLAGAGDNVGGILSASGMTLLAAGAAALNNLQDRRIDSRMARTRRRALPAARLRPATAAGISLALLAAGGLALWFAGGASFVLGLAAVAVYNGVYARLKRTVWWAAFVGALAGVMPPAAGWISGGGSLGEARFLPLAFFFYSWQIPHCFLLAARYGEEYAKAGLPSMASVLDAGALERLGLTCCLALGVSVLLFPLLGATGIETVPAVAAVFVLFPWFALRGERRRGVSHGGS